MTVQILKAHDGNPPKVQLIPKFKLTPGRKKYFMIYGVVTLVLAFLGGITHSNNFFENFMCVILLMLALQAVTFYFWLMMFNAKLKVTNGTSMNAQLHIHEYYKKVFQESGYQVDYEAKGILIDNKNKKIGFTITGADYDVKTRQFKAMFICDYSDIRSWSSNSQNLTERVAPTVSTSHNMANGITTHYVTPGYEKNWVTLYSVNVTINYPDMPLQSFEAKSESDATQWVARLDSLING